MRIKSAYKSINGDYVFAKCIERAKEYSLNGEKKLIDLSVGDVVIPPIKAVRSALKKQTAKYLKKGGFSGYPPDEGIFELRAAVSGYYAGCGAEVLPEEVFITSGAKPALSDLTDLAEFDNAVVQSPVYPLYGELCAAKKIKTQTFDDLALISRNKPAADLTFLCSPCNPTGKSETAARLKQLIRSALSVSGEVIVDGAYAAFMKNYFCPFLIDGAEKCVVEVRSYSKSLSFTGLRCGYVVIKKQNPLYEPYKKLLSLKYNGVNVPVQKAALAAYSRAGERQLKKRIDYYLKNAEILARPFKNCTGYAEEHGEAPYVFVKTPIDGGAFAEKLLDEEGVLVCPGGAFGNKNSVRLSCLCMKSAAKAAAKRIARFLTRKEF